MIYKNKIKFEKDFNISISMDSLFDSNISKLDNLSLASYLHEQQKNIIIEENGFWINIFNVINPVIPQIESIYPFIIYNDKIFPELFNMTTKYKINNTIEIIQCNNKIFYNFIHYRFIQLDFFNKVNHDIFSQFLNEDLID